MSLAFIGMGSNMGDGRHNLQKAWQLVGNHPELTALAISSPYSTRPVNKDSWEKSGKTLSEQWFTNAVGVLETRLSPGLLLDLLKNIELSLGRDRRVSVDRPIDLDMLYYDELVVSEGELELPHPEIRRRPFVLIPLAELAPDLKHPVTGLSTRQMVRALPGGYAEDLRQLSWEKIVNL